MNREGADQIGIVDRWTFDHTNLRAEQTLLAIDQLFGRVGMRISAGQLKFGKTRRLLIL
jgi:hypothetical protein